MSTASSERTAQYDQFGRPLDEVTRRGLAIYESRLKALLEPEHNGEVLAIHIETGDHALADSSPDAMRALRKLHPIGLLFLYTIGPAKDSGLARRMIGITTGPRQK